MISFNHVTKKYGKNLIFDDISFKFEDTGAYCITGENGAGKTTLLQLIAKLIKPTKGLIINENKTIYVNNENNVFLDLSLIDNFRLVNSNEDKINDVLENTKLKDLKDKKTSTLSYGERLRVAIGMALLGDYEILLFDEPTSNLDSDNASIIINLLLSYSNDKLIIITSNDKKEISCFNNILEIKERKILCSFNCALQDSYVLNTKSSKLIKSLFPYFYIIMTIFIALIINFYTIISVKNNDIIKGITEDRNVLVCEENDEFGLLNISDGKLLFSNNYTETKRLDFNFFSFNQSDELLESLNRDYSTTAINILDYSDYIFYNPIYVYAHLDDKLLNDEVIVTDYLYDSFIYFKLIENDNLKIGNLSYKIADIIKTNYSIEKEKFDILAQNFEQKSIKLDELSIAMLNKYTYSLSSSTRYSLVPIYTVKEQNIFRYMYSNIYFKDENEIINVSKQYFEFLYPFVRISPEEASYLTVTTFENKIDPQAIYFSKQGVSSGIYNGSFFPISRSLYNKFIEEKRVREGSNLIDYVIYSTSIVESDIDAFYLIDTSSSSIYYEFFNSWYKYVIDVYLDVNINDETILTTNENKYSFVNDKYLLMKENLSMNEKIIDNAKIITYIFISIFVVLIIINLLFNVLFLKRKIVLLKMYKLDKYLIKYRFILGTIISLASLFIFLALMNIFLNISLNNSYIYISKSIFDNFNILISLGLFIFFILSDILTLFIIRKKIK